MMNSMVKLIILYCIFCGVECFLGSRAGLSWIQSPTKNAATRSAPSLVVLYADDNDAAPSDSADYEIAEVSPQAMKDSMDSQQERERLKRSLLQLGASYDRGFGASNTAREKALEVLESLEALNMEGYGARGIAGGINYGDPSPLEGSWRMVWCTAQDVLVLNASPITSVGAIYQEFQPPIVTNIIDFLSRAESLLPPSLVQPSIVRARVTTRASPRTDGPSPQNRIGLSFEKVELQPVQVLGQAVSDVLPPLGFDLPKLPNNAILNPETGPGYFDITYLDEELLVIRQNEPGGLFALVKVENSEP